jgi:ATP phosphoribosyltransferase
MSESFQVRLGLPKGSLQEATLALMGKAGWKVTPTERSYFPYVNDQELEIILIRAQEMSRYVEDGTLDAGITGRDWTTENESDVVEVSTLRYAKQTLNPVRWVLAVPEDSPVQSVKDLEGKTIATELVNATRRWLERNQVNAEVEFSWGATEVKAPLLVDAIVELTETGSSLRAHNLRILDTVLESQTILIANQEVWKQARKREKLENLAMLLQSAIDAEEKVGIKLNVRAKDLERVLEILPALNAPTVSELWNGGWHAVEVVIDEAVLRELIPQLRRVGAEGIIEYPLNKVIL